MASKLSIRSDKTQQSSIFTSIQLTVDNFLPCLARCSVPGSKTVPTLLWKLSISSVLNCWCGTRWPGFRLLARSWNKFSKWQMITKASVNSNIQNGGRQFPQKFKMCHYYKQNKKLTTVRRPFSPNTQYTAIYFQYMWPKMIILKCLTKTK